MSEATWIALIGVAGTVLAGAIGALIPLLGQRTQRKHERDQWYAEFFLRIKVNAITSLYAHLATVQRVTASLPPSAENDRAQITAHVENLDATHEALVDKANSAFPYLSKPIESLVQALIDQTHHLRAKLDAQSKDPEAIPYSAEENEADRRKVYEQINAVREALTPELNPAILARIQHSGSNIDARER
jgi:hypothetical protein